MRKESPARSRLPPDYAATPVCLPSCSPLSLKLCGETGELVCRFPGSGFLPDGNSISAPWHARVIRRSWPASPKEKRSGDHSILSFLLSYLSRFGKVLLATFSLHFSFIHKMLTFKAPDTLNFRATGATILVQQVEWTKNRRRKYEIFAYFSCSLRIL